MPLNTLVLDEALKSVGVATVFIGDPLTASGLTPLGITEGDITLDGTFTENILKAPEYTGDVAHVVHVMAGELAGNIPCIVGDPDLWAAIFPTGETGAGWSNQIEPVYTSVVIIPNSEIGAGLSYSGTAWSPAAPVNAWWLWRCVLFPGQMSWHFGDGGKVIMPVRFRACFDFTKPEGHKVFTVGDPVTAGIPVLI